MGTSHHILNRHQSLYRRVCFSQSASAKTIHGDICSENKEKKPTSSQGCPESIWLTRTRSFSVLEPDYVRPSSNELNAIPSGRPNMHFFPSLCMYYALSLFNYVRLYKYPISRTGSVFFHVGFLPSSTPSSSEQYTILLRCTPTLSLLRFYLLLLSLPSP
ncbi:hypothetical protein EI94DRAFT_204495 [Lactarius quietus]|nr:hypothetical protein EI94DRAFT_204495 [Lactarius quietus]